MVFSGIVFANSPQAEKVVISVVSRTDAPSMMTRIAHRRLVSASLAGTVGITINQDHHLVLSRRNLPN